MKRPLGWRWLLSALWLLAMVGSAIRLRAQG
jgi:hypothetical protein